MHTNIKSPFFDWSVSQSFDLHASCNSPYLECKAQLINTATGEKGETKKKKGWAGLETEVNEGSPLVGPTKLSTGQAVSCCGKVSCETDGFPDTLPAKRVH